MDLLCDGCGEKFSVPQDFTRSRIQCPDCGIMCDVPVRPKSEQETLPPATLQAADIPPRQKSSPRPVESRKPKKVDEVGEAEPYGLVGGNLKLCPKCKNEMSGDSIVCLACGYDERYRAKAPRERPPIFREWENGWSATTRVRFYLPCQAIIAASMISGLLTGQDPVTIIVAAAIGSLLLVFLLGTYEQFIIRRTGKGRSRLWNIWHICFVRRPEKEVPLHQYDRIRIGAVHGADTLDWLFLCIMFCLAVIPALIWGYIVLFRPRYSVSLSGTGGFVEELLCRSSNLKRIEEIGRAMSDASGLAVERY